MTSTTSPAEVDAVAAGDVVDVMLIS